jgi:hypothetical protein
VCGLTTLSCLLQGVSLQRAQEKIRKAVCTDKLHSFFLQCVQKCAVHLGSKIALYRDRPSTLNELKTAINAIIRNISQAELQKVFANKIKRVQACIDPRGHHF